MKKVIKRFFDITLSILALIVLSPVFAFAAIGIKLSSSGPVFYKANRIGVNGKPFILYKFRSMHIEENAIEKSFIADSSRLFEFGEFLRKSKIDELPQLINIILGQMSIVGPRPAAAANSSELYTGKYKEIQSAKPGLTSFASLFDYKYGELFISDNDKYIAEILPVRLELELYYVQRWNLFIDAYLIIKTVLTIFQVVFGKKEFKYTSLEWEFVKKYAYNGALEVVR